MRKLWLTMLCTLAFLGTATVSEAKMFVSISDGTTTLDGRTLNITGNPPGTKGALILRKDSVAPPNPTPPALPADLPVDTLNILSCVAPCIVGFPSGTIGGAAGDTFLIENVSGTNRAKLTKLDSGT